MEQSRCTSWRNPQLGLDADLQSFTRRTDWWWSGGKQIAAFPSFSHPDGTSEVSHDWPATWNRPGRTGKRVKAGMNDERERE